jgi:hypothetical protein
MLSNVQWKKSRLLCAGIWQEEGWACVPDTDMKMLFVMLCKVRCRCVDGIYGVSYLSIISYILFSVVVVLSLILFLF